LTSDNQAEVLENAQGQRFVAQFPEGVTKVVQYGTQIKAHAVYLSQHQLLPYNRIQTYFSDQCQIPIGEGTLFNFNLQAFKQLTDFEQLSEDQLSQARIAHADETGININGKRH
jgi:transposase